MARGQIAQILNGESICDTILTTRKVVQLYIIIRLEPKLTFWAQIQHAAIKAANITSLLGGLMANNGDIVQSRR